MPLLKQSDRTFTPIPVGNHPARCYAMVSLGTQLPTNPMYQPRFQVILMFEFPNELIEMPTADGKGKEKRPMITTEFLNAYLGSPKKLSKTGQFLTSWRGKQFTEDELKGFDVSKVVGAPCLLNMVHEEKGGVTRDNIASISPLPKGMTIPPQHHPSIVYEIEQGRNEVFKGLPEWMQKMIEKCEEWNKPASSPEPAEPGNAPEDAASEKLPF